MHFTSPRERRLWLWLGVVLAAIYATLGRAPALAAALNERPELRDNLFFALFVTLVLLAIVVMSARPSRAEIGTWVGIVVVYLSAWLRIGTLAERTHLFEYGLVAALVHEALLERRANGADLPVPALTAGLIAALLGALDEVIQAVLPNRFFDPRDILFNTVAVVMIIGSRWALARTREWVRRQRQEG